MIEQDIPAADKVHLGDLVASPISDGSWVVSLGDSMTTSMGRIFPIGAFWWAAVKFNSVTDAAGNYYGDWAPPTVLVMSPTFPDALRAFSAPVE